MRLMSRSTERSIQPLYLFMIGKVGLGLVNSDYWLIFMLKKWWNPPKKEINRILTYLRPTSKKSNVVNSCVFCTLRCWDENGNARQIWEFCSSCYANMSISMEERNLSLDCIFPNISTLWDIEFLGGSLIEDIIEIKAVWICKLLML